MAGSEDVQIVGGLEHMHHIPMDAGIDLNPKLFTRTSKGALLMGITAEFLAQTQGISREEQDDFALRSHQQAAAAHGRGRVRRRDRARSGAATKRATASSSNAISASAPTPAWKRSPRCKPAFMPGMGTVTAGNSSPLNDGAAALLIMSEESAKSLGLKPLVHVRATAVAGVDPAVMGTGPVPATQKALKRAGLKLSRHRPDRTERSVRRPGAGLHPHARSSTKPR